MPAETLDVGTTNEDNPSLFKDNMLSGCSPGGKKIR